MKNIGLIGLNDSQVFKLKKQNKKVKFIKITKLLKNDSNNLNAIIAFNQDCIEEFIFGKYFKNYKNLEWIHLSIAGIDTYTEILKTTNITFTCGKVIQGTNVSEHAMAILLYLTRLNKKSNQFNTPPTEIYNKKIFIFGLGGIGISLAEKCNAFGCQVYSSSNTIKPNYSFIVKNYEDHSFIEELKKFDVVFITAPLTKETKNFFDKTIMSKMKDNSYLINVSRGGIINTKDLVNLAKKKKFAGVGLDVLDKEPVIKSHPLRSLKNVFLSDHTAGMGSNKIRRFELIENNIKKYLSSKKINNIINHRYGY